MRVGESRRGMRGRFARRGFACSASLLIASLLMASGARAYVPYRIDGTTTGHSLAWGHACTPLQVYTDDLPDLTAEQIMRAATAAASAWGAAQNPCTSWHLEIMRMPGAGPGTRLDGVNSITFRRTEWCSADSSGGPCLPNDPAQPSSTSVFAVRATGEIVEGDIEINAHDFAWADLDLTPGAVDRQDLQNVLTHEIGHLLGFADSCWTAGTAPTRPLDDTGQPAPACDQASAAVRDTTMFRAQPVGETQKRTLAPDDQKALCDTYPSGFGLPDGAANAVVCMAPSDAGGADTRGDDARDPGDTRLEDARDSVSDAADAADAHDTASAETADAGPPGRSLGGSGCGCTIGGAPSAVSAPLLGVMLWLARRRRSRPRLARSHPG